jgi:hypothetical protein
MAGALATGYAATGRRHAPSGTAVGTARALPGAAAGAAPGRSAAARAAGGELASLNGYSVIASQHRSLYWSVPAAAMFAPVAAHTELGISLLRQAGSPALRTRLSAPVALTALLAARLAFFDLRQPRLAEGYFTVALDAAKEAADRPLAAAVLAHMAFVPAYAGRPKRARDLMAQAHRQARGSAGPLQTAWMYAVESEVEAKIGGGAVARDLVKRAEDELSRSNGGSAAGSVTASVVGSGAQNGLIGAHHGPVPAAAAPLAPAWGGAHLASAAPVAGVVGPGEDPDWLDFFDGSRLAGFKGFSSLSAGRPGEAAVALETTLRALPPEAAKQRSVALADLSAARLAQGELDESARLLGSALAHLRVQWYGTGVERVDAVCRRLAAKGAPLRVITALDEARRGLELTRPA